MRRWHILVWTFVLFLLSFSAGWCYGEEPSAAKFSGMVKISCASGQVGYGAVVSEDLPTPGFENRWHFLFVLDAPLECVRVGVLPDGLRRTSATSRGTYTTDLVGWGMLEIFPGSAEIRDFMRRAAPGSESRPGRAEIRRIGDGWQLLIEERK